MTARILATSSELELLSAECARLGGELVWATEDQFYDLFSRSTGYDDDADVREDLFECPFRMQHGIRWCRKEIWVVPAKAHVSTIIHEMSHVFATKDPPHKTNEFDFFGWEVSVARALELYKPWSRGNSNYAVSLPDGDRDVHDWGDLRAAQKLRVIADRLEEAERLGLIDTHEQPLTLR